MAKDNNNNNQLPLGGLPTIEAQLEQIETQTRQYAQAFQHITDLLSGYVEKEGFQLNQTEMFINMISPEILVRSDMFKNACEEHNEKHFDLAIKKIINQEDINFRDVEGKTILMHAIINNFYYGVVTLLEKGADTDMPTELKTAFNLRLCNNILDNLTELNVLLGKAKTRQELEPIIKQLTLLTDSYTGINRDSIKASLQPAQGESALWNMLCKIKALCINEVIEDLSLSTAIATKVSHIFTDHSDLWLMKMGMVKPLADGQGAEETYIFSLPKEVIGEILNFAAEPVDLQSQPLGESADA